MKNIKALIESDITPKKIISSISEKVHFIKFKNGDEAYRAERILDANGYDYKDGSKEGDKITFSDEGDASDAKYFLSMKGIRPKSSSIKEVYSMTEASTSVLEKNVDKKLRELGIRKFAKIPKMVIKDGEDSRVDLIKKPNLGPTDAGVLQGMITNLSMWSYLLFQRVSESGKSKVFARLSVEYTYTHPSGGSNGHTLSFHTSDEGKTWKID
jgi:hypothetical protein